jgi:hypothetical protein
MIAGPTADSGNLRYTTVQRYSQPESVARIVSSGVYSTAFPPHGGERH